VGESGPSSALQTQGKAIPTLEKPCLTQNPLKSALKGGAPHNLPGGPSGLGWVSLRNLLFPGSGYSFWVGVVTSDPLS
jgi:hypothetical protein